MPLSGQDSFFFTANNSTVGELAEAISERYRVSILVDGGTSGKSVSGRVELGSLKTAIAALEFLSGAKSRKLPDEPIYVLGGSSDQKRELVDPRGSDVEDVAAAFTPGLVTVVGDQLLVEGTEDEISEIREIVEELGTRERAIMEILMIESQGSAIDDTQRFLDRFRVEAGLLKGSLADVAQIQQGQVGEFSVPTGAFTGIDSKVLFDFVERTSKVGVELRQQSGIVSGSTVTFEAGTVDEDQIFTRQPETQESFQSSVVRRVVGVVLEVRAFRFEGGWRLDLDFSDSAISQEERRTKVNTEVWLSETGGFFPLVMFSRNETELRHFEVPLLANIPFAGQVFQYDRNRTSKRELTIFARIL